MPCSFMSPSMNNMTMGRTKTHRVLRQFSNDISDRFNDYLSAQLHLLRQDRPRDFFSRDTTIGTSSVVRSDGLRFVLFLGLSSDGGIVVKCREFVGSHCYDSVNNI